MPSYGALAARSATPQMQGLVEESDLLVELSRSSAVPQLPEVDALELGHAATVIRSFFSSSGMLEAILSPFDRYIVTYPSVFLPSDVGQLRFNTEPEIWECATQTDAFFSITPLFRREPFYNSWRRSVFTIVDFYKRGDLESVISYFFSLLTYLTEANVINSLDRLRITEEMYDMVIDGPCTDDVSTRLSLVRGYSAESSFFEIDGHGNSTRKELFLITPSGYIELAALGIIGNNLNPTYKLSSPAPTPPSGFSGIGIGLERLLLADRFLRGADKLLNRTGHLWNRRESVVRPRQMM